jgi:hypothetical protein
MHHAGRESPWNVGDINHQESEGVEIVEMDHSRAQGWHLSLRSKLFRDAQLFPDFTGIFDV